FQIPSYLNGPMPIVSKAQLEGGSNRDYFDDPSGHWLAWLSTASTTLKFPLSALAITNYWNPYQSGAMTQKTIVLDLQNKSEYRALEVKGIYAAIMKRLPTVSPAGTESSDGVTKLQ